MATTVTKNDEPPRPDASLPSQISSSTQIPTIEAPEFGLAVDQLDVSTLAASLTLPSDSTYFLSPSGSSCVARQKKHPFCLADLLKGTDGKLESLGPDIATAEISLPADGSYIETSSGPAIRELKRRYDQLAGVCATFRSPYVITAFVNQHGKSMFRLGHRDEHSAPAASAAEAEERKLSTDVPSSPRTKRRSRLSMNFLPPTMFSKGPVPLITPSGRAKTTTTAPKKLHRKVRSIPDLVSAAVGERTEQAGVSGSTFAVTGRGHSQSVTAADAARPSIFFQPKIPRTDAFGELLDLNMSENTSSQSLPNSTDSDQSRANIIQPFGSGVIYNMPCKKGPTDRLRPPRQLREMQSFDSAITARQDDVSVEDLAELEHELARPPSAIRLSQFMPLSERAETPDTIQTPPADMEDSLSPQSSQLSSHYTIEVFNVLQKYSGLPVFESLVPGVDEGTTVIKLSLSTDTNVAPRDDPRFVIWGEYLPDQDFDDYYSSSRDSVTDIATTLSRRRSSRTSRLRSPGTSSSHSVLQDTGQRVLLAGTIERWLAQLTSDLNYDELLKFFLTYRTYVSAIDLCNFLICRFHWALQKTSSKEDETVHRIVRVRTFVAIRYWMLTFFTVDFIPNRELRLLIADWLNTLSHDPVLQKHMDGIGIIRRLIKVAKDCKKAHIKGTDKPKPTSPPRSPRHSDEDAPDHVLGKSFAKAIRKGEDEESDLDLDFLPDEAKTDAQLPGFPSDPANAHLTVGHVAGGVGLSQARPTSLPLSSFNTLRTEHVPGLDSDIDLPALHNSNQVSPVRQSALSRAFVRTIGRLGRWKRVLKPKSPILSAKAAPPLVISGNTVSAFDLEINASVDLLTTDRGVEEFLKMADHPPAVQSPSNDKRHSTPRLPSIPSISPIPAAAPITTPPPSKSSLQKAQNPPSSLQSPLVTHIVPPLVHSSPPSPPPDEGSAVPNPTVTVEDVTESQQGISSSESYGGHSIIRDDRAESGRTESFRSSSTDSFGVPLTSGGHLPPTFPGTHQPWQFDIVSIDDLDFSDTASLPGGPDPLNPPGLRKPKKLPMRRDFEFVRRSEVSSMGIISHESLRDSVSSSVSETSPTTSGPQPIKRWQMKSLQQTFEDINGDDKGDVEAALRRLEGQINPRILQENAEKVNGWVRNLQERMTNGDYENSIFSEDEVEGFIDEVDATPPISVNCESEEVAGDGNGIDEETKRKGAIHTPMLTQSRRQSKSPSVDVSLDDSQTLVEEAVPVEILQSRMSTAASLLNPTNKLTTSTTSRTHRSFILGFPAEHLAQHLTMIDRELFMSIKFEELVTGEWVECEEIDILDWAEYLKDRARWKAESRYAHKTTALAAVRARFNLTVAFVNAEVVLTPPNERSSVVSKFIRIAWHCYQLGNFQTLTAIITGLQSDWVSKAMRKPGWTRLGIFENRMFRDLRLFASKQEDFKFMRQAVDSIVDAKSMDSSSRTPSVISTDSHSGKGKASSDIRPAAPPSCVPFIGIYLSQLRRLNKLPAVIDPTAPNSLLWVDPITATFDPLARPDVFSTLNPLPPSMHLEPLINVHKQRRVAEVIKSLVAGQHLASRVHFDVDRKLFQKCLRLRGLDVEYLQRALDIYPD